MHTLLFALLLSGRTADVSTQAAAQTPDASLQSAAAATPENGPRVVPPGPAVDAQLRVLQERLFASEALSLDSRDRVTQTGRPVDARTAYLLIGRPDLAERVLSREIGKGIASGVGKAAVTVGLIWGVLDGIATGLDNGIHRVVNLCGTTQMDAKCADRSHGNWIPWTIAAGGVMTIVTAAVIPADPLDRKAKGALIDDYNRRLRAGIGLSGALETVERTANVRIAAVPDGQSGMLVAGCSF